MAQSCAWFLRQSTTHSSEYFKSDLECPLNPTLSKYGTSRPPHLHVSSQSCAFVLPILSPILHSQLKHRLPGGHGRSCGKEDVLRCLRHHLGAAMLAGAMKRMIDMGIGIV